MGVLSDDEIVETLVPTAPVIAFGRSGRSKSMYVDAGRSEDGTKVPDTNVIGPQVT